jgi:hypothetical protein
MYIKKLYHTNRWWFAAIVLFIAMQLFLNAKQGVVFSPVYHYGMYSGVIKPQSSYAVTEITVNGKKLRTQDFTPAIWDKISYTVELFKASRAWNSQLWNNDIKRLLPIKDSSKYINNVTGAAFNTWYKSYLQSILVDKIDSVAIAFTEYSFNGKALTKLPR